MEDVALLSVFCFDWRAFVKLQFLSNTFSLAPSAVINPPPCLYLFILLLLIWHFYYCSLCCLMSYSSWLFQFKLFIQVRGRVVHHKGLNPSNIQTVCWMETGPNSSGLVYLFIFYILHISIIVEINFIILASIFFIISHSDPVEHSLVLDSFVNYTCFSWQGRMYGNHNIQYVLGGVATLPPQLQFWLG